MTGTEWIIAVVQKDRSEKGSEPFIDQLQNFSYTNEHKIPMSIPKVMIKT